MTHPTRTPLPGHPIARTSDLREATDAVAELYVPHWVTLLEPAAELDMELSGTRLGPITAGYLRYGRDVRIRTAETTHHHINIPIIGTAHSRCGTKEPVQSTVDRAAVFAPGLPAELTWPGTTSQLCLMLDRTELDLELERLLGRPLTRSLEFSPAMDLTSPPGRSWRMAVALLEREAARDGGMTTQPLAAAHLLSLILDGLLLAQSHNYTELLSTGGAPPCPRSVRRAVELLESHPERPWSSATLAEEISVSVRALQAGFRRSVGMPPMTYLREVRLRRVHHELASCSPEHTTVGSVAGRWGFTHAGRFAGAYHARFGRPPSRTLRA
jgi:AraC-like DNA-binding protein